MNGTIVGTPDHLKMFYENDTLQAALSPDFYNLLQHSQLLLASDADLLAVMLNFLIFAALPLSIRIRKSSIFADYCTNCPLAV
jgi:hypothetical protein